MLRIIDRYLVTGGGEQILVGCSEMEDPIAKACRQCPEMRKGELICTVWVGRIVQEIETYERVKTRDIPHKETQKPAGDTLWSYVDARNDWSDPRRG